MCWKLFLLSIVTTISQISNLPISIAQPPSAQTPAVTNPEPQVIVTDIVINAEKGQLEPTLADKIRQMLTIKIGQTITRAQLKQNLDALKALGDFANVQIVPKNTAKGVGINILVKPYGTLRQVRIKALPATSTSAIDSTAIDEIFKPQYGKKLNTIEFQAAIVRLNQLYRQQGYDLAHVASIEELDRNGQMNVVIAEGTIEEVGVRFMNRKRELVDENKQPITSNIQPSLITRDLELKSGKIYNRSLAERDVRRIFNLGFFDDVRMSLAPARDRTKVIIYFDLIERKQ